MAEIRHLGSWRCSARRTWLIALVRTSQTLVWRFSARRLITFQPFLWITSQFHHGILEPQMKIHLCHCQFVLMLLNTHFCPHFYRLKFPNPSHWMFASHSWFSLSMEVCWARHTPIIADHHDTPAVTGGLHPLLDISPKNRRGQNAKTQFSQKLSRLDLRCLLTTDRKLCKLNWTFQRDRKSVV